MKQFPFLSTQQYLNVLRILVGLIMLTHGAIRIFANIVDDFGVFLNEKGFFIGNIIAWSITIFEIAGGLLLVLGYYRKLISAGFILILTMGIILVHFKNGWFVVGHTSGGIEYSVLLIFCLLLVAATKGTTNKAQKKFNIRL